MPTGNLVAAKRKLQSLVSTTCRLYNQHAPSTRLTKYMTNPCNVSNLVVYKNPAFPSAVSIPILVDVTSWALVQPYCPAKTSSMLTAALNQAAKMTACVDGRGVMSRSISPQNDRYMDSNEGR